MLTLAEKVIEASFDEDGPYNRHLAGFREMPDIAFLPGWEDSTGFEKQEPAQFLVYGFYFGLAYGIARSEEPFASNHVLVEAAKHAALAAHRSGGNTEQVRPAEGEIEAVGRRLSFTDEEKTKAEAWVVHKVEDAVSLNFVEDVLFGLERWTGLLRAIRDDRPLTDAQVKDLGEVVTHWRDLYAKEVATLDADSVDLPNAKKESALADALLASLAAAEEFPELIR